MTSGKKPTLEKSPGENRSLIKCSRKLTGISDASVIIWGIVICVLVAGMAVTQRIEVSQLRYQSRLRLALNDIHSREAFSTILNGIDPSNPASHAVTVAQLQNLPEVGEYEKRVLFLLADSKEYFVAKVAVHALVEMGTKDRLGLIKRFWRLCKMACDRGEYFKDREFPVIYYGIEPYLEDELKGSIQSAPISDRASIDPGQNQEYIDACKVFEVITYFSMLPRNENAPSGLSSEYEPTVLNLHLDLYRLVTQQVLFPDFFSGTGQSMYTAVTSGDTETYREIWKALHSRDELLEGGGTRTAFCPN